MFVAVLLSLVCCWTYGRKALWQVNLWSLILSNDEHSPPLFPTDSAKAIWRTSTTGRSRKRRRVCRTTSWGWVNGKQNDWIADPDRRRSTKIHGKERCVEAYEAKVHLVLSTIFVFYVQFGQSCCASDDVVWCLVASVLCFWYTPPQTLFSL